MASALAATVFQRSPVWLQNWAVGLYGLRLRRLRYGGSHRQFLADLKASDRSGPEALDELQTRLLRETVRNALVNVPYYQKRMPLAASDLDSLRREEILAALPLLPKATVRQAPAQFVAGNVGTRMSIQTSGSTGSPLVVVTTATAIQHNYAFFARFLGWHGVSPFDESATFAGRVFGGPGSGSTVQWRRNWAMHDTLFSSYHLAEASLPDYVRELERRQPTFIDSYPSSIYRVASFLDSRGQQHGIRPRVIITSSETLLDHQRQLISRVFACPVRDQYGSAEMAGFIAECDQGRYHTAPEYGVVEIVDAGGTPVPPGALGQMCLTGFLNPAMPLIRYLIGDVARLSSQPCACGRASPVVESLEGRIDDVIVTPSGRHVGRLDPAFKGVVGIRESQIIQTSRNQIMVAVVADDPALVDCATLRANLTERLGSDMDIEVRFVDEINKEANGKFRSVKSLLPAGQGMRS